MYLLFKLKPEEPWINVCLISCLNNNDNVCHEIVWNNVMTMGRQRLTTVAWPMLSNFYLGDISASSPHYLMSNGVPILAMMNLKISDLTIGSRAFSLQYGFTFHFLWKLTEEAEWLCDLLTCVNDCFLMVNGLPIGRTTSCRVAQMSWLLNYGSDNQVRSKGTTQFSCSSPKTTSFYNFL